MRLVSWNANYNARRRSLEENVALLTPFNADVLVISETAPPCLGNPLCAHWIGTRPPGLAVVARSGLELEPHPGNETAPPLMAGFTVRGDFDFSLLAAWPVQRKDRLTYHEILMAGLAQYADLLKSKRTIMAGDFNSSTRVSNQRNTHPKFVAAAGALDLVSAYHAQTGEVHGNETISTYRHGYNQSNGFHLDYCFVSRSLVGHSSISILIDGDWPQLSDHFPLVLDIPDTVFLNNK